MSWQCNLYNEDNRLVGTPIVTVTNIYHRTAFVETQFVFATQMFYREECRAVGAKKNDIRKPTPASVVWAKPSAHMVQRRTVQGQSASLSIDQANSELGDTAEWTNNVQYTGATEQTTATKQTAN
jgi:hypothetical protein